MIQISKSDYGHYEVWYTDVGNLPTLPDWNASLIWEFRDSTGVLRFTATTTSTPPLSTGVDPHGPYTVINGIPLTAFALGVVDVSCYAEVAGVPVVPSPFMATAFEVIDDGTLVDQLRELLKIDDYTQDTMLYSLIQSAADYASGYLSRTLLSTTRVKQVDAPVSRGLSSSRMRVPTILLTYPPVGVITRVYTIDNEGETEDIDSDDYWLDAESDPPELHIGSGWSDRLRIVYTCGYGPTYASLPDGIKRGILLHAAYMYKYRGDCPDGEGAEKCGAISAYRIYRVVRR